MATQQRRLELERPLGAWRIVRRHGGQLPHPGTQRACQGRKPQQGL